MPRLIFVCLTQIVLITVLISILSNQFAKYNSRDQYYFLFGILQEDITNPAYACVESISSDRTFDFYPPTNLLQLFFLRPLRLFLPSRHPFLQRSKFALLRFTHAPYVLGVTLFEQLFYTKNAEKRATTSGLPRPPSSTSARVAAKRASYYSQIAPKLEIELSAPLEEARASGSTETTDIRGRLNKLEEEISSVKRMLREVLDKL